MRKLNLSSFRVLILLIIIFNLAKGRAANENTDTSGQDAPPTDFIEQFVKQLLILENETEEVKKLATSNPFAKAPLGDQKGALPRMCHPLEFKKFLEQNNGNPSLFAENVSTYFEACSTYLRQGQVPGLLGLLEFASTIYDISKNPLIHKEIFRLSDGTLIRAIVAVKDHTTKRPWVIAKCGVFCNVEYSKSSFNTLMNYFDQSPFNVIFMSNHTGSLQIQTNQALTIGGFHESYDFFDLAHWLKYESPYRSLVDSIHAVGISLGGSAVLGVSFLSDLYKNDYNEPLYDSVTAICPVVNLGPTLKDMYTPSQKGFIFRKLTWTALKNVEDSLTEAHDYLSSDSLPAFSVFPQMLTDITLRYGHLWDLKSPPRRQSTSLTNPESLYSWTQFSQQMSSLKIPTLVWASKDDHIVNYDINSKTLINTSHPSSQLGAVGLPYGDHCGFTSAYGFGATTTVLQSFILNQSPNFKSKGILKNLELPSSVFQQWPSGFNLRQWWETVPNGPVVKLHTEVFRPQLHLACYLQDPFKSQKVCRKTQTLQIPVESLEAFGAKIPADPTQAQILSRQLNYSIRLTRNGRPIDGTVLSPNQMTWTSYEDVPSESQP